MKRLHSLVFGILVSMATLVSADELLVSAAISLKDAFREIGALYQSNTHVKISFNFGASGLLQKQIEGGAPVDVFASAGAKQMDELETRNLVAQSTRRNLVRNELVLVAPAGSKAQLQSFADLDSPPVQRIAVGNPKTVPAGQYTRQTLEHFKLWDRLQPKLVFAEDVRQVLDYVVRGEVEAGIVYSSDVTVAKDRVVVAARAPKESHQPILYPIAIVKDARHADAAARFIDLTLSDKGQRVLEKCGFLRAP